MRQFSKNFSAVTRLPLVVAALLVCVLLGCGPLATAQSKAVNKNILYLSAYSYDWRTVPAQMRGLREALPENYALHYEFMDTKCTVYSKDYREFYELLRLKLAQNKYDGIVVADDAALNFVRRYREELFPRLPVTFTGIDNVEEGIAAARDPFITGVVEKVDYPKAMKMAAELFPKARQINFIYDNMENGIGILQQLKAQHAFPGCLQVRYINSSELTREEMIARLESFTPEDIVFCIALGKSKDGYLYGLGERARLVQEHAKAPVLRITEMGVGQGFCGGYVVDHEKSARLAGELLLELIEKGKDQPPVLDTPQQYLFDYRVLQRFGVSLSQLEKACGPEVVLLHRPEPFLTQYAKEIILGLCGVISLLALAGLYLLQKKNRQLKEKNVQLQQALLQAEMADRAKQAFLGQISHDVRTPINGILGLMEMAERCPGKAKQLEKILQETKAAGYTLLEQFNKMLDITGLESGELSLKEETVCLGCLLRDVLNALTPQAVQAQVTLESRDADARLRSIFIKTSPQHLRQLLTYLVENGLKFNQPGGRVSCSCELLEVKEGKAFFEFVIADDGQGMSEDFLAHIFEPFVQETEDARTQYRGMGLGLAITRSLVERMGGTIEVQSKKGEGTTFRLVLPFKLAKAPQQAESVAAPRPDLAGMQVLAVEDNELNRQIVVCQLEEAGVLVTQAADGQEALELYLSQPDGSFDLVLTDLMMPVLNGYELAKAIRHADRDDATTIPILALSANAFPEDVQASIAAGINQHLAKPLAADRLYEVLARYRK